MWGYNINFKELQGKVFVDVEVEINKNGKDDEIIFTCHDGEKYKMYHWQNCCESVTIEEIIGNMDNLLNSEILLAEETTNHENSKDDWHESFTWTFYKLSTIKGDVTIRWYGESNGYYSEEVSLEKIEGDE